MNSVRSTWLTRLPAVFFRYPSNKPSPLQCLQKILTSLIASYRHQHSTKFTSEGAHNKGNYFHTLSPRTVNMNFHCQAQTSPFNDSISTYNEALSLFIFNTEKWLRNPVNIKEANKQAKISVGKSLTLHIFCFMLTDYA